MMVLLRITLVGLLVLWTYLFFTTPKNVTDLAAKISQVIPSPKAVGQAVHDALHPAPPLPKLAPPPEKQPEGEQPPRQSRIRIH
jgi:hypothetical protein